MSPGSPAPGDRAIVAEVAQRADAWLPGGGTVAVDVLHVDRRTFADLHHLRVRRGAAQREVVVKVSRPGPTTVEHRAPRARPRLIPPPDPSQRWALEAAALRLVGSEPAIAGDPSLHAVEVLAALDTAEAIVLERISAPTLREATARELLRPRPTEHLRHAHERAGRWLRAYHRIATPPAQGAVRGTRADAVDLLHDLAEHLAHGGRRDAPRLASRVAAVAGACLPEQLPVGLRHDDFAPRNVLVREDDVVVIDVLARFTAPVYEDLGCFVSWLRSDLPALASRGLLARPRLRQELERAFLTGYFAGEPVPLPAIRFHELVTALDRACAWVDDGRGDADRGRRMRGTARRAVGLGPLLRRAGAIVDDLERA